MTPEELKEALILLQNKLSQEEAARNAPRSPLGEIGKYARWMKKGSSSQDKNQKTQKASGEEAGDPSAAEEKLTSGPGAKKADGTGASGAAPLVPAGKKGGADV